MGSETVSDQQTPAIPRRTSRKRLTEQDILAMADLNAKRLNDVQACELLDINYETWRSWKTRAKNQPRYARILSRIKGTKIKACMDSIEKAGDRDWRATREYLSLIEPEQFNDRMQQPINTVQVSLYQQIGIDVQRLIAEAYSKPKAVDVPAETKLLPHKSE